VAGVAVAGAAAAARAARRDMLAEACCEKRLEESLQKKPSEFNLINQPMLLRAGEVIGDSP